MWFSDITTYYNVYSWSEKLEWEGEYVTEMKLSCSCPVSTTRVDRLTLKVTDAGSFLDTLLDLPICAYEILLQKQPSHKINSHQINFPQGQLQ